MEDWTPGLPFIIDPCVGCQLGSHLEITQAIQTRTEGPGDANPVYRHRLEAEWRMGGMDVRCACECTTEKA